MSVRIFNLATDELIGVLTEDQFRFLQEHLEAEDADDDDYYLNRATLDAFAEQGGDPSVIDLLRWQREDEADSDPSS